MKKAHSVPPEKINLLTYSVISASIIQAVGSTEVVSSYGGAIAGRAVNSTTISNSTVITGIISSNGAGWMGGLLGYSSGATITNCSTAGIVSSNHGTTVGSHIGGMVGYTVNTNISKSYSTIRWDMA